MSLYVGHISPHVRQDELERVFQRFGHCNFQLKEGYGFVVYEVSANAERALRAMRGKQVCGEHLILNWSNKQPRPFTRPMRGSGFNEPYQRGAFREEEDFTRFRRSQDRRDISTDGGPMVEGLSDKEAGHAREDSNSVRAHKNKILTDSLIDEDIGELNSLEHDRWGVPTSDMLPGHGHRKSSDFDRYEPYHGYKRGEKESSQRSSSDSSRGFHPRRHKKRFIGEDDRHLDTSMPPITCYNCGQLGHIKRTCPEVVSRQERFTKFEHTRDGQGFADRGKGRMYKFQVSSQGRPYTRIDPFIGRRSGLDRVALHSSKIRKQTRVGSSLERKEKHRSKLHSESKTKKEDKKKLSSKKGSGKKRRARSSDTSSTSSDSSKSSSTQSSSKSTAGSRSLSASTSKSSRSHPSLSRLRSLSISSYAKSKSSRSTRSSRSLSRSRSSRSTPHRSLSLSVSLGEKSSSSPKNIKRKRNISVSANLKENSEHVESSMHFYDNTNSEYKKLEDEISLSPPLEAINQANSKFNLKVNGAVTASKNCPETSALNVAVGSARVSTEEMLSALCHYGLVPHKMDEGNASVEGYFGAARLWPWEMIYYRRQKRGPISTENYAKRLEQNKEFGIVDKYIRSSSGWGES